MHIPDGYLTPQVFTLLYIITIIFWIFAFRKANKVLQEKEIPLLAVLAAGIFAAQMLNFPIIGGTSGHLIGSTLAAIYVGPYGAIIVLTIVLFIQTFLFGDGGVTALGANVFNMGILAAFLGYFTYKLFTHYSENKKTILAGGFIGGWLSIIAAAAATGVELGASNTLPYIVAVPAMVGWHVVIGIGEGIITVFVLAYTLRVRPDLLKMSKIGPGESQK